MRAFITGSTGFAGTHLLSALLAEGHQVNALVHEATSHQELPDHANLTGVPGDLLAPGLLRQRVAESEPDVIFHLAGQAYPARSWQNPALTMAINAGGTANLLEAAVAYGRPRVVIITSAEIYGKLSIEELPITEETLPLPRHPYGVSKVAAGQLGRAYWERYQLPVVEARPFNHIGPNQAPGFVVPDFAGQLAAIRLGQQLPEMRVGNLNAQRDFTDVRDVARAYMMLATDGAPGQAYLICSGQPVRISDLLQMLIEAAGVEVEVKQDPALSNPSDTPCIYGSNARIGRETGWQPRIPLAQSLADALTDWEARLSTS